MNKIYISNTGSNVFLKHIQINIRFRRVKSWSVIVVDVGIQERTKFVLSRRQANADHVLWRIPRPVYG